MEHKDIVEFLSELELSANPELLCWNRTNEFLQTIIESGLAYPSCVAYVLKERNRLWFAQH